MISGKTLYDTFNAKYLGYDEIAATFIYNHQFEELIKNNHSLLMGPRGSGKTTMLRMLTPLGLHHWEGEVAESIKTRIPFIAIYIPTDIQWKRQIEQLSKDLTTFKKYTQVISRVIVTTNILLSVTKTFKSLIELHASDKNDTIFSEAKIADQIIVSWQLKKTTLPTFLSIEMALMERIVEIKSHSLKTIYTIKSEDDIEYPPFFFQSYLDLVRIACTSFEREFNRKGPEVLQNIKRWALCFDELEIAPEWLQLELIDLLRGGDQNILFKLTTSPIVSLYDEANKSYYQIASQENNDFKVIRIWVYNNIEKKRWIEFGEQLIDEKIKRKFNSDIDLKRIFGSSDLDRAIVEDLTVDERKRLKESKYSESSISWFLFRKLSERNDSFRRYLQHKGIDPKNPIPIHPGQKDSIYRKAKQLAAYRLLLTKDANKIRSRKVIPLYFGIPLLYEISDGNPRLLIGLFDELISNMKVGKDGAVEEFPINHQSRIITEISEKFISLVDNHPEANKLISNRMINLGQIIKEIGTFFYKELIEKDFNIDPRNTFIIDEEINQKFVELIQLALQLGIIIYVNPNEALSMKGFLNKEFRLNYLLCPYFQILTREYDKPVMLSRIIGSARSDQQSILFSR